MRRLRKRRKSNSDGHQDESIDELSEDAPPKPSSHQRPLGPISRELHTSRLKDQLSELDELDDFDQNSPSNTFSLPSGESRKEPRLVRHSPEKLDDGDEDEPPKNTPIQRSTQSTPRAQTSTAADADADADEKNDIDELDDYEKTDFLQRQNSEKAQPAKEETTSGSVPEDKEEPVLNSDKKVSQEESLSDTPLPDTPLSEPLGDFSLRNNLRRAFTSLSPLERTAVGLLLVTLLVVAIWSSSFLFSPIPRTIIASKLRYPLKGDSVVITDYKSYWRSPIREGDTIDEGVPLGIEIIPVVELTLGANSQAQALRFLFRNEEGRYVGDATTVETSGGQYLAPDDATATIAGSTAIIRSTTGFELEGELIAYLADDSFQWEVVILESRDGKTFTEFMNIPISANRKDKS